MKALGVTLIIPSYNGDIENTLSALKTQTLHDWDYVIQQHTSPAARARNLGAQRATGEYLVFLDDDVKFSSPNVLENVLKTLKFLGPKDVVNITWRLRPDANWIQRIQSANPTFTFDRSHRHTKMSWKECGAACFAIRSDWFSTLGGFDEDLVSGEDCDLAYRLVKAGGKIVTLPDCWIEHDPPQTFKGAVVKAFWYERGNAQVTRKHPEASYRINLNRPWKAIAYLFLRSFALVPLMFFKVTYLQRQPILAFRPLETLLSYLGSWAYVREWLFPTKAKAHTSMPLSIKQETKEVCVS